MREQLSAPVHCIAAGSCAAAWHAAVLRAHGASHSGPGAGQQSARYSSLTCSQEIAHQWTEGSDSTVVSARERADAAREPARMRELSAGEARASVVERSSLLGLAQYEKWNWRYSCVSSGAVNLGTMCLMVQRSSANGTGTTSPSSA